MQKILLSGVGEYSIRQATSDDVPAVIGVNVQTLPEHYSDYFYYEVLNEHPQTFLVAELKGEVVGYIMCRIELGLSLLKRFGIARKGHIISVAVLKEHRGKGLGSMMIHHVIDEMRKGGSRECVKGDTIILGDNKPISRLESNDGVIGLTGCNRVKGTMTRYHQGELVRINANGMLPIEVTPEHPVFVSTSTTNDHNKVAGFSNLHWKRAQDLTPKKSDKDGDYLVLPRLKGQINLQELDFREFTSERGMRVQQRLGRPLSIPLNGETAWLLGIYVAEGSSNANGPEFSFAKNETALQERVMKVAKSIGYTASLYTKRTAAVVRIHSPILARAFEAWCGKRAVGKRIPDFILMHSDGTIPAFFVRAWEEGDSCTIADHGTEVRVGNTVSKVLALQLQLLYAREGILASLSEKGKDGLSTIEGRTVRVHKYYEIRFPLRPVAGKQKARMGELVALSPIHKVDRVPYEGSVFNIETEDNTYLVSNAVVHNCYLEVRVSNTEAVALYSKLNFKMTGTLQGYYKDGEAAYTMAIQL